MAKKVTVLCSFIVEVELTDEQYERRHFVIEDNGCPGTGVVGAKIIEAMAECDEQGICWACKLSGQNRIILDTGECRHVEMKT